MFKKLLFNLLLLLCYMPWQVVDAKTIGGIEYDLDYKSSKTTAIVIGITSEKSAITIPSTIYYSSYTGKIPVSTVRLKKDATTIKSIDLPSSLTDFSSSGLPNLEEITISPENKLLSTEDGILFSKSKRTLVSMPRGRIGDYSIPIYTDSIAVGAFNFSSLYALYIHENVHFIGHGAFRYSPFIKGIHISESNKIFKDIDEIIYNTETHTLLHCPNWKKGIIIIPESVTEIADGAFIKCMDITSIIFPRTISKVGFTAVWDCSNCNSIVILGSAKGWGIGLINKISHNGKNFFFYARRDEFDLIGSWGGRDFDCDPADINNALGISVEPYVFGFNIKEKKSTVFENIQLSEIQTSENDKRIFLDNSGNYDIVNLKEDSEYKPLAKFKIGESEIIAELELKTNKRRTTINPNCTQTGAEIRINATEDVTCAPTKCGLKYDGKEYFANNDNIVNLKGLSLNQTYSVYPFAYYGEELISESRKDFTTKDVSYTLLTKNIGPTHCELDVDVDSGDAELISSGFSNGKDKIIATGLAPDRDYTFTLNVNTNAGQSSNNYKITTSKLEIKTLQPKVVSLGCAIVGASTNISEYENSAGFQWKKYDAPESLKPNEANAIIYENNLEGYIKNLQSTSFYNVRAFYKDAEGKYYFGEWVTFDPADFSYFEPTVRTYATTECSHNTAFLKGYAMQGSEPITEQGFQYWESGSRQISIKANESHQIHTITASGQVMTATIENLKSETSYKFRAYAKTASGIITGDEQEFTTKSAPSGVEDVAVSPEEPKIEAYYNIGGLRSDKPFEGLNIVVYSNGTTRKIVYRQQ